MDALPRFPLMTDHDFRHLPGRWSVAAALCAYDAVNDCHPDAGQIAKLHAVEDVFAWRVLRLVHDDEIGGAADLDDPAIERTHACGVAGCEAECKFGRH